MGRRRQCENFAWRDKDPEYRSERDNDRVVFRKIRSMIVGGLSADKAIDALFTSDFWHDRMCSATRRNPNGKTHASWKRCYYRWRAKIENSAKKHALSPPPTIQSIPDFGDSVQAENEAFHPCISGLKREPEKFYQETMMKYAPSRGDGAFKSASGEVTPRPPGGTEKET